MKEAEYVDVFMSDRWWPDRDIRAWLIEKGYDQSKDITLSDDDTVEFKLKFL